MIPTNNARKIAIEMYSLIPLKESAPNPEAMISESIATGPIASWREVPIIA